jgi:hypothetical protein
MNIRRESFSMELVKNKASGKSFIVLDDEGDVNFLLITPEGKVKHLNRNLFETQIAVDSSNQYMNFKLTKSQMEKYNEYAKNADY